MAGRPVRVCQITAELAPFAKTGGLGDVAAALARYLHEAGQDVRAFLPLYGNLRRSGQTFVPVSFLRDVPLRMGGRELRYTVYTAAAPGTTVPVYFVSCDPFFARKALYSAEPDEALRFAVLTRAALESCQRMGWSPDIVHAHDWHAALAPLYLRTLYSWDRLFAPTKTVLTIHNLAYQGRVPADAMHPLDLAPFASLLHQEHLHHGYIGFMETGLLYADAITTVSRTYAREILTPRFGLGLDGLLRARAASVFGIVNGIDPEIWSPEKDTLIPHRFSADDLEGKARCKLALLAKAGMPQDAQTPLVGIVSRLTSQKGFDLCHDVLPELLRARRMRLVVLGSGDPSLAAFFARLAASFPDRAAYTDRFDDPLAHLIEAGSDIFLMPSRFEPCGLNQMYSQRYGTIPVVHRTGGLADTVELWDPDDRTGTGLVFEHHTVEGLRWALGAALDLFADRDASRTLQRNAMARDFSWTSRVGEYVALYRRLMA